MRGKRGEGGERWEGEREKVRERESKGGDGGREKEAGESGTEKEREKGCGEREKREKAEGPSFAP